MRSPRPLGLLVPLTALFLAGTVAAQAPKKPELVPPVLTSFVEATYPPEAEKEKLEANVVLALDIDAAGADGGWSLDALPPGTYRVHIASPGFQTVDSSETVVSGVATELVYRLALVPTGPTAPREVVVQGERPPREVTRRTLEQRELAR